MRHVTCSLKYYPKDSKNNICISEPNVNIKEGFSFLYLTQGVKKNPSRGCFNRDLFLQKKKIHWKLLRQAILDSIKLSWEKKKLFQVILTMRSKKNLSLIAFLPFFSSPSISTNYPLLFRTEPLQLDKMSGDGRRGNIDVWQSYTIV